MAIKPITHRIKTKLKLRRASPRTNLRHYEFSRANLAMVTLIFAGIGGYVLLGSYASSPPATPAVQNSISSMQPQYLSLANTTQNLLSTQASQADTQYYSNGTWISSTMNPICPSCMLGPATEAAVIWSQTGKTNTALFQRAVDSFNASVAAYQNADGSVGDSTSPEVEFFGNQLGSIYWELHTNLDATTKANWQLVLSRLSDWLVSSGNISWYTNGNVNLGNTKVFYLTWLATGQKKYKDYYEQSLQFTISPPQDRWPGYGLMYSTAPTKADGSDGAGYLTEKGSGSPGYDGDYTQLQLSEAGSLYLYSLDPRILRLSNLFVNQLLPHVNTSTFILDATNGSRHSTTIGLFTGALATLAWQGGREDLLQYLQGQYNTQIYANFYGNANQNWASPGLYRDYGLDVGQALLAADLTITSTIAIGDLDASSNVNIVDLSILLSKYGTTDATADINKDRIVNVVDLSTLLSNYSYGT